MLLVPAVSSPHISVHLLTSRVLIGPLISALQHLLYLTTAAKISSRFSYKTHRNLSPSYITSILYWSPDIILHPPHHPPSRLLLLSLSFDTSCPLTNFSALTLQRCLSTYQPSTLGRWIPMNSMITWCWKPQSLENNFFQSFGSEYPTTYAISPKDF